MIFFFIFFFYCYQNIKICDLSCARWPSLLNVTIFMDIMAIKQYNCYFGRNSDGQSLTTCLKIISVCMCMLCTYINTIIYYIYISVQKTRLHYIIIRLVRVRTHDYSTRSKRVVRVPKERIIRSRVRYILAALNESINQSINESLQSEREKLRIHNNKYTI